MAAVALVGAGAAQSRGRDAVRSGNLSCADRGNDSDRASNCEVREDTIGGANPLDIDAGRNGGIHVRGWDRGDFLVRAPIEAQAETDAQARRLVTGVSIDTAGARVRADGPDTSNREESWSVR